MSALHRIMWLHIPNTVYKFQVNISVTFFLMNILVYHIIILGEKRHPYNKCCQCYKYCRNGLMFWKYLCICYEQLVTKYMIYDINFVIYSWLYTPNKSFCSRKWDTFQHMKGDNFHKYCQYCLKNWTASVDTHSKHSVEVSSEYLCNFLFDEYFSMSYYMLN